MNGFASFSAAAVAAAATERALGRLLRGATWQALTCEIAWHAAATVGADHELIAMLAEVADESLSELIDGVEYRVDATALRARRDHLHWRPHDHAGAELVAVLEAEEEAERLVAAAYERARHQTEAAARSRRPAQAASEPRRRLLGNDQQRSEIGPLPPTDLGQSQQRYGWPRQDAA